MIIFNPSKPNLSLTPAPRSAMRANRASPFGPPAPAAPILSGSWGTTPLHVIQARHVAARTGVQGAVARVVAELAFAKVALR